MAEHEDTPATDPLQARIHGLMDVLGNDLHAVHQVLRERRVGQGAQGHLKDAVERIDSWRQFASEALNLAKMFASHGQEVGSTITSEGLELGYSFAAHGLDLGYSFAYHGLDLGYEFASKGETVGPMANRVLFMAVQIGVMADRIGEMADRILFMADRITEFGDKIVYESQLIVYTEQLIIDESVLIERVAAMISRTLLALAAMASGNTAALDVLIRESEIDRHALDLIYQNLNLMLDHMQGYALAVLAQEERNRAREIAVRKSELQLRQATMSANECYCPLFGAAPAPPPPPDLVPPYPAPPPVPTYPPVPPCGCPDPKEARGNGTEQELAST